MVQMLCEWLLFSCCRCCSKQYRHHVAPLGNASNNNHSFVTLGNSIDVVAAYEKHKLFGHGKAWGVERSAAPPNANSVNSQSWNIIFVSIMIRRRSEKDYQPRWVVFVLAKSLLAPKIDWPPGRPKSIALYDAHDTLRIRHADERVVDGYDHDRGRSSMYSCW